MKSIFRTAARWLLPVLLFFIAGCGDSGARKNGRIGSVQDLNSSDILLGGMVGIPASQTAVEALPRAQFLSYSMPIDAFTAICSGKIDAVVLDRPTLEYMALAHPELTVLPEDLGVGHISVAAAKGQTELMGRVNEFIRQYRQDGTYRQMYERWFHTVDPQLPEIPRSFLQFRTLKIGITANNEPMCFLQDGKLAGFDSEFALRLGHYLRRRVEFVDLNYEALPAALAAGRIDLAVAQMDALPEREESMLFSDNYIDSPIAVLVRRRLCRPGLLVRQIAGAGDLNQPGRPVLCLADGLTAAAVKKSLPAADVQELPETAEKLASSLSSGRVWAAAGDSPLLENLAARRPELRALPDRLGPVHYAVAGKRRGVIEQINGFIRQYRQDGTYRQMYRRWIGNHSPAVPELPMPASAVRPLKAGIASGRLPLSGCTGGKPSGFDAEFFLRLGPVLGRQIQLVELPAGELLPALAAGQVDLIAVRREPGQRVPGRVFFSEDYLDAGTALLIRAEDYCGGEFMDLTELAGRNVGTLTGSAYDLLAAKAMPPHRTFSFSQLNQEVAALEGGKIDAFFTDAPVARFLTARHPGLTAMPRLLPTGDIALAFAKDKGRLCAEFSAEIRRMKASGELNRLQDKWFSGRGEPQLTAVTGKGRKLIFGGCAEVEPMVYIREGKITGYEADVAAVAANRLGYRLEYQLMDPASFTESLRLGKYDLAAACIIITPERRENLNFSEPVYQGGIALVVRRQQPAAVSKTPGVRERLGDFCFSLGESFHKTFVREHRWKLILRGLGTTFVITFFSVLLGTVLAFPVWLACRSRHRLLSWLGDRYISLIMGTPILVILMILYYVIFAKVDVSGVVVAVLAFGMDFAAYTSVTLRSGIDGVPRGQMEAALALGHRPSAAFFRFILPQAVRTMLPVYRGEVISTLKATSIVGYIAIMDLTKMGDIIRSRTYEAFFPLIAIAAIYFLTAKVLTALLEIPEYYLNPEVRRNRLQKRGVK